MAVSKAVTGEVEQDVSETVVRNRSRYADLLHRPDPDSDDTRPACPTRESEKEYTTVPAAAYLGHYKLCGNPACFGGDWR
ncbi:hypothetical protein ACFQJ7_14115 [Halovenus rubra]|uniref:Uncharacterized protein n=2 Tax=Halovenus rubra TaxID=869890 RepID=A0ABD5XFJ6_9EURY|nr:hypothetical protein [Halovenus rubra]